jgi:hypothetical protein
MKNHTKIYLKYFGYGLDSYFACEVCDNRGVDLHHIENRGMGGSKTKDYIENLICVCRQCHEFFGEKDEYLQFLKDKHYEFMQRNGRTV